MTIKIIKLTEEHVSAVKPLFYKEKYMGVKPQKNTFIQTDLNLSDFFHEAFCSTYLSDLKNFHAYGAINDENLVTGYIGFYESNDDSSWYWTQVRSSGNDIIKPILDLVLSHNERKGRFKFYSMFPLQYRKSYRKLAFSNHAKERYDYFDEYFVKEKHQPIFNLTWQILYNRTLIPTDTIVRCTFLKQKYREVLFDGGRL